jgi:hypothetical protein
MLHFIKENTMRKVEMNFFGKLNQSDSEIMQELADGTAGNQVVNAAIGYLATWSCDRFDEVKLNINAKELEITAVYYGNDGNVGYVIGAVWHDGHFGFHS